jgi:hypothetical protein
MTRYKVVGSEVYHDSVHLPQGFELELSDAEAAIHGEALQKVTPPRKGLKKNE